MSGVRLPGGVLMNEKLTPINRVLTHAQYTFFSSRRRGWTDGRNYAMERNIRVVSQGNHYLYICDRDPSVYFNIR